MVGVVDSFVRVVDGTDRRFRGCGLFIFRFLRQLSWRVEFAGWCHSGPEERLLVSRIIRIQGDHGIDGSDGRKRVVDGMELAGIWFTGSRRVFVGSCLRAADCIGRVVVFVGDVAET